MLPDMVKVAVGMATNRVASLADDIASTSRSNRGALATLVRYEVDRALGGLGFATSAETAELTERVRSLEAAVRSLRAELERLRSTTSEPSAS